MGGDPPAQEEGREGEDQSCGEEEGGQEAEDADLEALRETIPLLPSLADRGLQLGRDGDLSLRRQPGLQRHPHLEVPDCPLQGCQPRLLSLDGGNDLLQASPLLLMLRLPVL